MSKYLSNILANKDQKNSIKQAIIQSIDPRARVIALVLFTLITAYSSHWVALLAALFIALSAVLFAKQSMKNIIKRLAILDTFMLYLLIFLPFSMPGDVILSIFGFVASWQGFMRAVEISLSANAIVLMIFAMVSNLTSNELGSSLQWFKVPGKLIQLLQFTMRYLTVIEEEFNRLRRSMRARAFVMKFNLHTWKTMGNLIAMMLVRAMQRAQRTLFAMKCRGFNGEFIYYSQLKWRLIDSIFLLIMCLFSSFILVLNFFN